ncbi:MAG: hypothetical protein H6555_10360 [Lewinellaceae bacterium]|nr:hypothetical protein [Lewinellaceae bacterium]
MKRHNFLNPRYVLLTLFALATAWSLGAQNISDVLRYSVWEYGGTARFVATGSSMSALGADLSVSSTNPAGIGLFRRSEYSLTPALLITNAQSRLLNDPNRPLEKADRGVFNVHNFGMVFTSQPLSPKWKQMNFGITINHLANLNRDFRFVGQSAGSLTQRFQEVANGGAGLNDYETGLASDAGALYDIDENGIFDIDYELTPEAALQREQTATAQGSMSELAFSFGANYDEKVIFGVTIGVPFVNYVTSKTYAETDPGAAPGNVPYFTDLRYEEDLTTTGGGVNAKVGVIIRPQQAIRVGLAVHTPTNITLTDDYTTRLIYNYFENEDETGSFLGNSGDRSGSFEYKLRTPWRYFGSLGLIFGKRGFLTGEVEYVDFRQANFNFQGFTADEADANQEIKDLLQSTVNIRLGAEVVAREKFRFRAGLGINPSPFQGDENLRYVYSAGAGIRGQSAYVDLAYRRSSEDEFYYPYSTTDAPLQEVQNTFRRQGLVLTVGMKF